MLKAKEIILLRHAKSSWSDSTVGDFDRTLNEKGKNDIKKVKNLYKTSLPGKTVLYSSPAKRTSETASSCCGFYGVEQKDIVFVDSLYLAEIGDFLKFINQQKNDIDNIIIVSHNFGLSNFAHYLLGDDSIGIMPTLGMVHLKFQTKNWKEISESSADLIPFVYPKMVD